MRLATLEDLTGDPEVEELRYARLVAGELSGDPAVAVAVFDEMLADPRGFTAALQALLVEVIGDVAHNLEARHGTGNALEAVRATIATVTRETP